MTYAGLCKATLDASDTGDGATFLSVEASRDPRSEGYSLFAKQVAEHVREAWIRIQLLHDDWEFRQAAFMAELDGGHREAYWDQLSLNGHQAIDARPGLHAFLWREEHPWTVARDGGSPRALRLSSGQGYERGELSFGAGVAEGRPAEVRIDSFGGRPRLRFDPAPETGAEHVLFGEYVKGAEILDSDGDVPGIAEQYHDVIKWKAVIMLHGTDESADSYSFAISQYRELMDSVERRYRRSPSIGALA